MKEGWEIKKMGEVFDLQMGKTPSRDNNLYWGGNNTWVSISDLKTKYILDTKESITDIAINDSKIKIVPKDTVIMSFKLSVGKVAITREDLYTNEAIMSFRLLPQYNILTGYIYYYLLGYKWKGSNKAVMGLTLNKSSISSNVFSYPNISEQTRIVEELDLLNGILDKKRQQLKELDSLSQSIFYDMFGDPIINNKGWEIKTINDICKKVTDGEHLRPKVSDSGIPFLSAKDITNGYIDFNNTLFVSEEVANKSWKRCCPSFGDIMIISRGATIGRICRVNIDKKFCLLGSVILLQLKNIESLYVEYLLKMPQIQSQFINMCGAAAQQALYLKDIKILSIPVPPITLQNEFADKIKSIERQKQLIKASIAETQTLLDSRMDYYFN